MNIKMAMPFLVLNCLAIFIYFWIANLIGLEINFKLLFSTNDAITYREVAHWISENTPTESTSIRPVLYPLFLAFTSKLGGVYGIWFMQFVMWLLSINFTFSSIHKLTKSIIWSSLGALLIISNLSLIALTHHALTEVTTVFLLSLTIYFCIKNYLQFRTFPFFRDLLIFFVLLTLVKPVFYIPLLGIIFVVLPLFYFKALLQKRKNILIVILVLLPILFQLTLVKIKHNDFTVSTISGKTVDNYIIAQSLAEKYTIERDSTLLMVSKMTAEEKASFIKQNFALVARRFKNNITENIISAPIYLMSFVKKPNQKLIDFMLDLNETYYKLHRFFLLLFVPFLLILYRKKENNLFYIALFFGLMLCYYLLTTGISYWQGDRLTIAAIGIFSFLYVYMAYELFLFLFNFLKSKISSQK